MVTIEPIRLPEEAVNWSVEFLKARVPPWSPDWHKESPLLRLDQTYRMKLEGEWWEGRVIVYCFDQTGKEIGQICTPTQYLLEEGERYRADFIIRQLVKARAETEASSLTGVFAGLPRLRDGTPKLRRFLQSLPKLGGQEITPVQSGRPSHEFAKFS